MRKRIVKGFAFLLAAFMTISIPVSNVYAEDDNFAEDSSGNVFGAGETVDTASQAVSSISNELFEAGYNVKANDIEIGGSAFLAGNDVSIKGSTVDGSIFIAGRNLYIDSKANNNIWAAGQDISLGKNTSVKGVHLAAATVEIAGSYEGADIVADTVTFDAKVSGKVTISAEHVSIGPNADVAGEIIIKSVNEPKVNNSAKVDNLTFKQVKKASDDESMFSDGNVNASSKSAFLKKIKKIILNIFKFALLGIILTAVLGKKLNEAYDVSKKRPGAVWGFGFLTLIATPIIAIILCITIIGLPIAGLMIALYALLICFSRTFMFASLVRGMIFNNTDKKFNAYIETTIALVIGAILKEIPIIGALTGFIGILYTLGYVILLISGSISSNKKANKKIDEESVA